MRRVCEELDWPDQPSTRSGTGEGVLSGFTSSCEAFRDAFCLIFQISSSRSPHGGEWCFIEDAMIHLHHLHGGPVSTSDLRGQGLPENRHLFAIRRANAWEGVLSGQIKKSAPIVASLLADESIRSPTPATSPRSRQST